MEFKIPKTFTLGGVEHKVTIKKSLNDDSDFGCYYPEGIIELADMIGVDRCVSDSLKQQTFFHELTHAILRTMRKDDLYHDESFVNTFAAFFSEAINTMEE